MPISLDDTEVLRAVIDSLDTGVFLVDLNRRILLWNRTAEKISGYLRHEVIGRFCHDNILEHCDESLSTLCGSACSLDCAMKDGARKEGEVYLRHKKGHRVPVNIRTTEL